MKRISSAEAFEIFRLWHKDRALLLFESFDQSTKQRREWFVVTKEISEGTPSIIVTTVDSPPLEDLEFLLKDAEFDEDDSSSGKYARVVEVSWISGNRATLSEVRSR